MLFLCRPELHRAGTGRHGNAIKKTAFRRAGPHFKFERPLLRAILFFCGVKNNSYSIPRGINSRSTRPGGWDVRQNSVGLLQNSARKSPTVTARNKKEKEKRNACEGGGINDDGALNRPFPFAQEVNNPSESDS